MVYIIMRTIGLRPIICLKSDVQLEKQSDDNYKIVDDEQGGGSTEPQTGAIEYGDLQWDDSYSAASVTVSKTGSNTLELQYRTNTGEWQTVDSGYAITGLKDGDIVTACLFDGSSRGYYTTLNVVVPGTGIIVDADDIAGKPEYYGEEVKNYQPSNGDTEVKWKIFYAGTNPNDTSDTTSRIYLIADDYISSQYAPDGKKGSGIEVNSTDYILTFDNVISDYSGSSDITNSLVKPWLSYLNSSYGNSTYNNMKAVAYMLDTNVWSTFKDSTDNSGKAEYAIGGPTLDLFSASYNQKYPSKQIQYQSNTYGYQVKWSTGGSYTTFYKWSTNKRQFVRN